jgi:hypothetical protein
MWTDLMLDRVVDDRVIVDGMAYVFGVRTGEVALIDDIEGLDDNPPIIITHTRLSGDFPLQLSIYLRYSELEQRVCDPEDEQTVIARLCAEWRCSALFSDDDLNPYRWLLMSQTGRLAEVTVDADRLDDQDAFVITRVDRMVRQIPVAV